MMLYAQGRPLSVRDRFDGHEQKVDFFLDRVEAIIDALQHLDHIRHDLLGTRGGFFNRSALALIGTDNRAPVEESGRWKH